MCRGALGLKQDLAQSPFPLSANAGLEWAKVLMSLQKQKTPSGRPGVVLAGLQGGTLQPGRLLLRRQLGPSHSVADV